MSERRIISHRVDPPIPFRGCDWTAVFVDYEPGEPQGWGRTEREAIEDLEERESIYQEHAAPQIPE